MDAPDVWVAKHDGSDVIRAAASLPVRVTFGVAVPGARRHPEQPWPLSLQLGPATARTLTVSSRPERAFGLRRGGRAGIVQHELPLAACADRG